MKTQKNTENSSIVIKLKCCTYVKIASFHPVSFLQTTSLPHSLVHSKLDSTRHEIGVLTWEFLMPANCVFVPALVSMAVKLRATLQSVR